MKRRLLLTGLIVCALVFLTLPVLRDRDSHPQKPAAVRSFAVETNPGIDHRIQPAAEDQSVSDQPHAEPEQSSEVSGSLLTLSDIPEGPFKVGLTKLSEEDLHRVLKKLSGNPQLLSDVKSIRVDSGGMIYYVCSFGSGCEGHPEAGDETAAEPLAGVETGSTETLVPITSPPALHSRPGAPYVLFLDFNGHVIEGTRWNATRGVTSWNCLPYDKDGDTNTFSAAELSAITQIWERVAEDFAPFDVDITTEQPAAWSRYTGHALITPGLDANGVACPHNGYGGIAYLDVFGSSRYSYDSPLQCYSPAWCKDYEAGNAAEVISHELGHNLDLSHDKWSDLTTTTNEYYSGHGNGSIKWGPIMGSSYYDDVSQWSKGDYYNAYESSQDDLAIMASFLGYRSDDHGDSNGTADPLGTDAYGYLVESGVIETTGDTDVFSFAADTGSIEVFAAPYRAASGTWGGNLDIHMALYDSLGTLIATNNPELETTASLFTNLSAGTYYLQIKPTGVGNPLIDPPTGYVLYGSLGQYDIRIIPPGGIPALPSFSGMENGGLGVWRQSESDDMDWTLREGETPSSSTGPSGASGGSFYLYTEASSHYNQTASLETPRFNLSASGGLSLMFDFHMYGSGMGSLSVDVYDGVWHNDIWTRSGQQHTGKTDPWEPALVELSAFAGKKDIIVRLRGVTGSSFTSDIAIDNIRFSLDLDFDGLPDSWEFQYFGNKTSAVATIDGDNDGACRTAAQSTNERGHQVHDMHTDCLHPGCP